MSSSNDVERIRIVVVEDHRIFRGTVCGMLERDARIDVVGIASDGVQGLSTVREVLPDVALIDLRMDGMKGTEVIRELRDSVPAVRSIALTVSQEQEDVLDALRAGAKGYVVKSNVQQEIIDAVMAVARGDSWLSPRVAHLLIEEFTQLPSTVVREALREHANLTPREQTVLSCLSQGMTNREIGERLFIAETTVKTHLNNILEKLNARNRLEAAAIALNLGLTSSEDMARPTDGAGRDRAGRRSS
jgi:DNA-binding NarL/FixJ family response regulator